MKQLLEDYLGYSIYTWEFSQYIHSRLEQETHYENTYQFIESEVDQPYYKAYKTDKMDVYNTVYLEDLLVFIYNNKK